jgi:SAM-dependent methyltransferase
MSDASRFNAAYYRRYYKDPRSRVATPAELRRRAELIGAFCRHHQLKVRSILDAGCGLGLLREPLLGQFPRARYTGLEYSQYLCERLGWQQGSIADWPGQGPGGRPFDLVVCYDVMQYLGDRQARTAIANLARLCGSVLHFNVLTRLDWEQNCDRLNTDGAVYIRSGGWYRRELGRGFANAGSCLYLRHGAPVQLWELEGLDRPRGRVP